MTRKPGKPGRKEFREFGFGLGGILIIFALLAARKHSPAGPYLFGFGTLALAIAWVVPSALEPVYGPWMRAARVLAAVNTFLISALIFYLVMTPYALVARLFGKDPLDERLGTDGSYWKPRGEPPGPASYERQF